MFDTGILKNAMKARRLVNDQERCKRLCDVASALRESRERYGIREAYIVGSLLVSRRWDQMSDIDVAVGGCSAALLDVMKDIELITDREVDVIDLDSHPFSDVFRRRGMKIYG